MEIVEMLLKSEGIDVNPVDKGVSAMPPTFTVPHPLLTVPSLTYLLLFVWYIGCSLSLYRHSTQPQLMVTSR